MTISSTTTKNSYSGNDSTTAFAYGFFIPASTDIQVIVRSSTGTETVKTEGTGSTNYGISGVGSASGGTVTFVTAPTSTETVVLRRSTAQTQGTDYVANDPFPAETHEDALDKLTIIGQDLQEQVDRSLKISRTNTMTSTDFTNSAADRSSKVLAFDSSGEISVTQEIGNATGNWAASTAYVLRDIIKDTDNNNIYICITAHTSSGSVPISSNTDSAKWRLLVDAASATTSATSAATSATAAASSATAAASSATAAAASETAAETAETNAETAETNAETAETNAETAETNAETSETNAASSATAAASSATSASSSASTATTQASNASTSASSASTSATTATTKATAAATSATNAATSATNAATSATTATTQATSATTQATNAATSATAAAASATAAATSADNFDDVYLGSKGSAPTLDNDGDALTSGDLYFNSSTGALNVWNGSTWVAIAADTDVKTLVSANDTTAGYLNGKLVAGSNVTFTENNDGSDETLTIAATDNSVVMAIALGA